MEKSVGRKQKLKKLRKRLNYNTNEPTEYNAISRGKKRIAVIKEDGSVGEITEEKLQLLCDGKRHTYKGLKKALKMGLYKGE